MSDRKTTNRVQQTSKYIWKLYRRLTKGFVTWLLRAAIITNRTRQSATGFVLPTTIFLILVVTLTAGALSYRAFNSSTTAIGNVQSRAIYNAATPAIDRARSKMEYLFQDPRYPGGVPSEGFLNSMMLNDGRTINGIAAKPGPGIAGVTDPTDPYTLLGEKRVDLNGSGTDNAWAYHDDKTKSTIIYSISFATPPDDANADTNPTALYGWKKLLQMSDKDKASGAGAPTYGPFVRSAPLSNSEAVTCRVAAGSTVEQGWYQDATDTSKLRKRFQVDAFVVSDSAAPGRAANYTTLEFQQDRLLERGNKWGAWFRNDLEIHPGAPFNWNGAMHSEGSVMIGSDDNFSAYLISSPNSCLFLPETNSEISVRQVNQDFFGVVGAARINADTYSGNSAPVHIYKGKGYDDTNKLTTGTDWVQEAKTPFQTSIDSTNIQTTDGYAARGGAPTNLDNILPPAGITANVFTAGKRLTQDKAGTRPYIDDTYRADNRYGPKVVYKDNVKVPLGPPGQIGNPIPTSDPNYDALTRVVAAGSSDAVSAGLDGYWERRSIAEGLRILVGQRLELGNPSGWVAPKNRPVASPATGYLAQTSAYPEGTGGEFGDFSDIRNNTYGPATATTADIDKSDSEGDPLYPPYRLNDSTRAHEERQRRSLRDNLAAVQATAVYHYSTSNNGLYPDACLATTAHPGSPYSLQQSVNFLPNQVLNPNQPWFDFFYGKGTNGWEFTPPAQGDWTNAGSPMGIALRNLAAFAGDYNPATNQGGAFPPQQGTTIRPDPTLTMWGNFSNLRRAVDQMDGKIAGLASGYTNLSPADQTYLHTAGCTLGMLAYNINQVQQFNPSNPTYQNDLTTLANSYLFPLMNGNFDDGEVLPKSSLGTYSYDSSKPQDATKYNPRDYDNVSPEMFLTALRDKLQGELLPGTDLQSDATRYRYYQLATLIHEQFQIRRDRTYGFRPSPAANTWNYNPFLVVPGALTAKDPATNISAVTLWSSACDPNIFNVTGAATTGSAGANIFSTQPAARYRLALSRLCGAVIPPGAVHDEPGDGFFPARNNTSAFTPDTVKYTPEPEQPYYESSSPNTEFSGVLDSSRASLRAQVAPEFPSLYYIFPEFSHGHAGAVTTLVDHRQPGNSDLYQAPFNVAFQPWKEPYITNPNVPSANTSATAYQVVPSLDPIASGSDAPGVGVDYSAEVDMTNSVDSRVTGFKYIALSPFPTRADLPVGLGVTPKAQGSGILPAAAATAQSPNRILNPDGSVSAVAFQDKVLFNGREWQPSRVLDMDVDMLRRNATTGGQPWLPTSGIVYAFREDGVREDAIARPGANTTIAPALATLTLKPWQTNATVAGSETDPTVQAGYVTTKTVDFIADPDRRVHGFRLRNGDELKRIAGGVPDNKNTRGISFISDNLAYIMGNFNRHKDAGNKNLEEFLEHIFDLGRDYNTGDFYGRSTRDTTFAQASTDLWRPSEVLADGVTILSNTFCDGSLLDGFMTAGTSTNGANPPTNTGISGTTATGATTNQTAYQAGSSGGAGSGVYNNTAKALYAPGCTTNGATSFMNQNRPDTDPSSIPATTTPSDWVREIPNDPLAPVKISRNGNPLLKPQAGTAKPAVAVEYAGQYNNRATTIPGGFYRTNEAGRGAGPSNRRPLQTPTETTVNTIMISGIVPSRQYQGYGGLHNFPRLLEWWQNVNLNFSGSFLQLNFSNYGTAPYDQDDWEPGQDANSNYEAIDYYGYAPNRRWGYDVALQMVPAGPAANRFVQPSSTRNEFYDEPPANDFYMQNLCTALKANASAVTGTPPNLGTVLNCPT